MSISIRRQISNPVSATAPAEQSRRRELRYGASVATALFGLALALMAGAVVGLWLYGFTHSTRIYEGVSIGDVHVGGMSRAEAREAVTARYANFASTPILLRAEGKYYSLDPQASGISLDIEGSVENAYRFGREGSLWSRSQLWADGILDGKVVPIALDVDTATIDATIASIADQVTRAPKDAQFVIAESGNPEIIPELPGVGLDVAATRNRIVGHMRSLSTEPVDMVTPVIDASVTVADLEPGLEQARIALESPFVVAGLDHYWGISSEDLRKIVSLTPDSERVTVDREAVLSFVTAIAGEVDQPSKDASLTVDEDGRLAASPSEPGIAVEVDETTDAIVRALQDGYHKADLSYGTALAPITTEMAEQAAKRGEEILDRGVVVTWGDGKSKTLDRATLLDALTIRIKSDDPEPFVFGFDRDKLAESLAEPFAEIGSPVKEPRLRLDGDRITIAQEGTAGEVIDEEASIDAIIEAALDGSGKAELAIEKVEPTLSLPVIADIELDDVLAEASTYYGDSSEARRQNVEKSVELEDGWLVAPGAQFSYVENIGDITEEEGFVTGFGIVEDPNGTGVTTAPVIGGGICQVSTTIFQAAFWAGLQIDERYSHPYWIQSYGEPPRGMKGLDAMVNIEEWGSLDLKFTNNTGNWIAVVVIADGVTVTARIVGTDPGWTVEVEQPIISNIVKPPSGTTYTDSPELPKGEQLQVEYAQDGFSSEVVRVVTAEDGEVISSGSLVSTYAPSRNTILRGTGSE